MPSIKERERFVFWVKTRKKKYNCETSTRRAEHKKHDKKGEKWVSELNIFVMLNEWRKERKKTYLKSFLSWATFNFFFSFCFAFFFSACTFFELELGPLCFLEMVWLVYSSLARAESWVPPLHKVENEANTGKWHNGEGERHRKNVHSWDNAVCELPLPYGAANLGLRPTITLTQ